MIAAMRTDEARKRREQLYMKIIARCGEDEIDELQKYFMTAIPKYIRDTLPNENQYRALNVLANDLGK